MVTETFLVIVYDEVNTLIIIIYLLLKLTKLILR